MDSFNQLKEMSELTGMGYADMPYDLDEILDEFIEKSKEIDYEIDIDKDLPDPNITLITIYEMNLFRKEIREFYKSLTNKRIDYTSFDQYISIQLNMYAYFYENDTKLFDLLTFLDYNYSKELAELYDEVRNYRMNMNKAAL